MRLVGPPERLALHGGPAPPGDAPVVALGDATAPADVVWLAAPADAAPGVRTIATGGEGLWRRAPLPAADDLFALPLAGGSGILVAGGDERQRDAVAAALAAAGAEATTAALPSPQDLAAAAVVALAGEDRAPLPSLALPVLASGRLLLAPRAAPAFGLAPGVDHLAYAHPDELARLALAAVRHPEAFAPLRALGRLAAEPHRASVVLARV